MVKRKRENCPGLTPGIFHFLNAVNSQLHEQAQEVGVSSFQRFSVEYVCDHRRRRIIIVTQHSSRERHAMMMRNVNLKWLVPKFQKVQKTLTLPLLHLPLPFSIKGRSFSNPPDLTKRDKRVAKDLAILPTLSKESRNNFVIDVTQRLQRNAGFALDAHSISLACYGLHDLSGETKGEEDLFDALASRIKDSVGVKLTIENIHYTLYGLQSLNGQSICQEKLISALAACLRAHDDFPSLNYDESFHACYCVNNLDRTSDGVQELIQVLTKMIKTKNDDISLWQLALRCSKLNINGLLKDNTGLQSVVETAISSLGDIADVCLDTLDRDIVGKTI